MPLTTRKANEGQILTPSFMFVGDAGSGKTTLLAEAAKFLVRERGGRFLILAFEPKDRYSIPSMLSCPPEVEICDQPKWREIMEVFTSLHTKYTAGIGIDGFDGYVRESFYDILGVAGENRFNIGQNFLGHQNAHHIQLHRMQNHFLTLLNKGIPIVATSRLDSEKDEAGKIVLFRTNAQGSPGLHVPPLFTVLGLCRYKGGKPEKWVVNFRPEYKFPARDAAGRLDPEEPAIFEHIWRKSLTAGPVDVGTPSPAPIKPTGGQ